MKFSEKKIIIKVPTVTWSIVLRFVAIGQKYIEQKIHNFLNMIVLYKKELRKHKIKLSDAW